MALKLSILSAGISSDLIGLVIDGSQLVMLDAHSRDLHYLWEDLSVARYPRGDLADILKRHPDRVHPIYQGDTITIITPDLK